MAFWTNARGRHSIRRSPVHLIKNITDDESRRKGRISAAQRQPASSAKGSTVRISTLATTTLGTMSGMPKRQGIAAPADRDHDDDWGTGTRHATAMTLTHARWTRSRNERQGSEDTGETATMIQPDPARPRHS